MAPWATVPSLPAPGAPRSRRSTPGWCRRRAGGGSGRAGTRRGAAQQTLLGEVGNGQTEGGDRVGFPNIFNIKGLSDIALTNYFPDELNYFIPLLSFFSFGQKNT